MYVMIIRSQVICYSYIFYMCIYYCMHSWTSNIILFNKHCLSERLLYNPCFSWVPSSKATSSCWWSRWWSCHTMAVQVSDYVQVIDGQIKILMKCTWLLSHVYTSPVSLASIQKTMIALCHQWSPKWSVVHIIFRVKCVYVYIHTHRNDCMQFQVRNLYLLNDIFSPADSVSTYTNIL